MGRLERGLLKKNGFFPEDVDDADDGFSAEGVLSRGMMIFSFAPKGEAFPGCRCEADGLDAAARPLLG